ncbi:MAG TPA: hypothetical protein DCF33_10625 [Saprospirales bacterium]|nr:hypothetical protein [Saprospirales bacterium]
MFHPSTKFYIFNYLMRKNFPPNTTCPAGPSPHFGKAPRLFFIRAGMQIPSLNLFLTFFLLAGAHLQAATITSGHTVILTAAVEISTGNPTLTGTLALAGFNLTAGRLLRIGQFA